MSDSASEIQDEGFVQYPVPGIDNNSQGFRDRYRIIRDNIIEANAQINSLTNTAARRNADNAFGGRRIIDANLSATTTEANLALNGDPVDNTFNVNWNQGMVQVIRVGNAPGPLQLFLDNANWPSNDLGNRLAKITLIFVGDEDLLGDRAISWQTTTSNMNVKTNPAREEFDAASFARSLSSVIFEVFTYDRGVNLFIKYVGRFE